MHYLNFFFFFLNKCQTTSCFAKIQLLFPSRDIFKYILACHLLWFLGAVFCLGLQRYFPLLLKAVLDKRSLHSFYSMSSTPSALLLHSQMFCCQSSTSSPLSILACVIPTSIYVSIHKSYDSVLHLFLIKQPLNYQLFKLCYEVIAEWDAKTKNLLKHSPGLVIPWFYILYCTEMLSTNTDLKNHMLTPLPPHPWIRFSSLFSEFHLFLFSFAWSFSFFLFPYSS